MTETTENKTTDKGRYYCPVNKMVIFEEINGIYIFFEFLNGIFGQWKPHNISLPNDISVYVLFSLDYNYFSGRLVMMMMKSTPIRRQVR